MSPSELKKNIFIGVVEDNNDPKKLGRCRCRVLNVFDDLPAEDLPWASPWKDLNGNQFILPEKGKVVSVVFDDGNIYKPEYICSEHYNANLEKKLASLSGTDYISMRALLFDHKTQIYSNDSEGLKLDYKFNNINITSDSINLNLKDNFAKLNLGSSVAQQQSVLGNNFFDWFDRFLNNLLTNGFLDGQASPLVPTIQLLADVVEYQNGRILSKYLSKHVNIVDNDYVNLQERIAEGQIGDSWKSTVKGNDLAGQENVNFGSNLGLSSNNPIPRNGDLTSQSGSDAQNVAAIDPGPISPSTNPSALQILETMRSKKYVIYTRPYELNIVAIRRDYEGMQYSNSFRDDLFLIYKIDSSENWVVRKYKISTMPGYYLAYEYKNANGQLKLAPASYFRLGAGESWAGNTKDGKPIDIKLTSVMQSRGGMGILKPAQYINIYTIGTFIGAPAMLTLGNQKFYRDKTPGKIIKYTSEGEYNAAMYVHRGYPGGFSVDNWSEGCQVFNSKTDMDDFFVICDKHKEKYGNKFSYTLMEERSLISVPDSAESSVFPKNFKDIIK
jgi:hypothetical protein